MERLISLRSFFTSAVGGGERSIVPSASRFAPVFMTVPPVDDRIRSAGLFISANISSADMQPSAPERSSPFFAMAEPDA